MKTPQGRMAKIAALVAMLARGETIVPNRPPKAPARHENGPDPDTAERARTGRRSEKESDERPHREPGGRRQAALAVTGR